MSLGAIAFTTPLTAWHFQSVSLAGPLANLLCLWAVSLAFLGGLAAAVLGVFLPGPAALLALPAALPRSMSSGWRTPWRRCPSPRFPPSRYT